MNDNLSTVPVVCAIIEKGRRFLAARRAPGRSHAGLWEFPGGKVRTGESEKHALCREIMEELGVTVTVGERIGAASGSTSEYRITLTAFRCSIGDALFSPVDHDDIRWVTDDEARGLAWSPADRSLLERYCSLPRRLIH